MSIEIIKNKILQERQVGGLSINCRPAVLSKKNSGDMPSGIINEYVQELGYHAIEGWHEVSIADALQIIVRLLTKDLAYDITLMSHSQARNLANSLLSHFSDSCRFFTNGAWHLATEETALVSGGASWTPISDAVFDAGVVFVCSQSLGIFWVSEDD